MEHLQSGKSLFDTSDGDLKRIVQVVDRLKSLNNALKEYLPGKLGDHCMVANLSKGKLIITLDSSAWASKFYYEKPSLLSKLRQSPDFAGISHIEHRVDPDMFKALKTEKPQKQLPTKLSKDAGDALKGLMDHADENLKAKLKKLQGRFE